MNIRISPEVLAYLKQKGKNDLCLTISESGGGCCPTIESAEIELIEPKDRSQYQEFEQDGIHVHVSNKARVGASTLNFKLKKGIFMTEIVAEGLFLKSH